MSATRPVSKTGNRLQLSSPVTDIPRIGPAKAKVLARLGITHVRDFIYTFPRRYDDFSKVTPIAELQVGSKVAVRATVTKVKTSWGFRGRRRLLRIFVELQDGTGTLSVTWYNLRFLVQQLQQGRELFVAGTVEPNPLHSKQSSAPQYAMRSPALEFVSTSGEQTHTAAITPIYPETTGVTSRFLRYHVKQLLPVSQSLPEYLPPQFIKQYDLMPIHDALRIIHFPANSEELAKAQQRLRFDELFFLQLAAQLRRQQQEQKEAPSLTVPPGVIKKKIGQLPFALTGDQQQAVTEIMADMKKTVPMNRLLQGDVGSGKSVVSVLAAFVALQAGYKVLYLAPTEILARQQATSFAEALGEEVVVLLIGAQKKSEKTAAKSRLQSAEPCCIVGTHALLQDDIAVAHYGLAIVDEQHRFGVSQRSALQTATASHVVPHLLSMTATPIPRTLNLTVYGDLDVSILKELPPGRKPIVTKVVAPEKREEALTHILDEIHQGRQAYVIAPLVEKSDRLQVKSATETVAEMKQYFPGIATSLLHGKLPAEEKESIMRHFAAGAIQLLVSTSVVEVGVNVPNATCMIIEGAERFGLSQLHQFRGRVGRGEQQSYCYLFPTNESGVSNERLQALAATTDGFKIAERDLELRGPGEMYGVSQSGFGDLQVASLLDYPTIKNAQAAAQSLLEEDTTLHRYPLLRAKAEQKNMHTHFE